MDTKTVIGIGLLVILVLLVYWGIYNLRQRIRTHYAPLFQMVSLAAKQEREPEPRSLNGMESMVLPLIQQDFPDFDPTLGKNQARTYITGYVGKHSQLTVHNVVIARYLNQSLQKTIVYQAAVSWRDKELVQKRYDIYSSYLLPQGEQAVAANCPNCGATLGFGEVECPYCGSRVANPMRMHWEFTHVKET